MSASADRSQEASVVVADHLSKSYGDVLAVTDVSFELAPGSILGLIGPSGGGKTTLLRLLCGLEDPTSGSAECLGVAASDLPRRERARLALLAQDPALIREFTIVEQVRFQARLRGVDDDHVFDVLQRVGLSESFDTRLSEASGGMRRRTGLASALVGDPILAFCDEPTAGLDPIVRDSVWSWFLQRRRSGRSMVVTTQHIGEAARCDRVIVLREGQAIADAVPAELAAASGLGQQVAVVVDPTECRQAHELLDDLFESVASTRNEVVVTTSNASDAAGAVANALASASIEIEALDTRVPGLDKVFRAIVGES